MCLDPRFRALEEKLQSIDRRIAQLLELQRIDVSDLDIKELDKSSTFTDTEVMCQGYNLIQISTDGDLTDVSYKVMALDGREGAEMEASESPHIIGPITSVKVTNDTAESGKTVRVSRYRIPWPAISAIKHGTATSAKTSGVDYPTQKALINVSKAIDTDWFASDITPTHPPCMHRIQISVPTSTVVRVERTRTVAPTMTDKREDLNEGNALTANALYVFDILVMKDDGYNIQHATGTQTVYCAIAEYPVIEG